MFGYESWLIRKDPDAGKNWRQEKKGTTEDEMVGWHHQLNGHEFEQASGDGKWQGSLACCSPWDQKVGHDWVTEQQIASRTNFVFSVWPVLSGADLQDIHIYLGSSWSASLSNDSKVSSMGLPSGRTHPFPSESFSSQHIFLSQKVWDWPKCSSDHVTSLPFCRPLSCM